MLTIFYDGYCPLCKAEMTALKQYDHNNQLQLENIHDETFTTRFPKINPVNADKILHGQLDDGRLIFGLEVSCLAWKLVNKHPWIQVLRWPVIKQIANVGYLVFARYRHSIAALVSGKKACQRCNK
ncbi:MAG: thiol-disulfide oxidoreductase DCC family protein [Marinomonas sp.]